MTTYRHQQLLRDHALDPELADEVLPLFRPNDYDTLVFKAFKLVEMRVRKLGGFADDVVGGDLMRKAFHPEEGPLTNVGYLRANESR